MKLTAADADRVQAALLSKATSIITPKRAGYSPGQDPFSNFRMARLVQVEDWRGCLIRLLDKVGRASSLTNAGQGINTLLPSPALDALLDEDDGLVGNAADLVNYVVLHLCLAIEAVPDEVAQRLLTQLDFPGY